MQRVETTTEAETLTVGQLAERYGVTVRTLHHYDSIGLLVPSERSGAGYRLYTASDVQRLNHVVVYRRLGFGLDEVAELLSEDVDVAVHLRRQRASVTERIAELEGLVEALDHALEREMNDRPATTADLQQLFGGDFEESYAVEAEERWGDTDAWRQSQERTARMTREDWEGVKAEGDRLDADMVAAVRDGVAPTDPRAMDLAERHRRSIEVFYDCDADFHRNLGALFASDERYRSRYERLHPGLTDWLRGAIEANADRRG